MLGPITKYRYDHYTWPEMRQVVARQPVCILPIGSVEDHGRHLPLDVDNFLIGFQRHPISPIRNAANAGAIAPPTRAPIQLTPLARARSCGGTTGPAPGDGRETSGFGAAERKARHQQNGVAPGDTGETGKDRPSGPDPGEDFTLADAVAEPSGRQFEEGIAEREDAEDVAHLHVGSREIRGAAAERQILSRYVMKDTKKANTSTQDRACIAVPAAWRGEAVGGF
jgi:hypothetical protein